MCLTWLNKFQLFYIHTCTQTTTLCFWGHIGFYWCKKWMIVGGGDRGVGLHVSEREDRERDPHLFTALLLRHSLLDPKKAILQRAVLSLLLMGVSGKLMDDRWETVVDWLLKKRRNFKQKRKEKQSCSVRTMRSQFWSNWKIKDKPYYFRWNPSRFENTKKWHQTGFKLCKFIWIRCSVCLKKQWQQNLQASGVRSVFCPCLISVFVSLVWSHVCSHV